MQKLIILIPCYNEEKTLPVTLKHLPHVLPGIATIEVMVVDDGSTDRTQEVAQKWGVHHLYRFSNRVGLAGVVKFGYEQCLRLGADIVVKTDGDHQYPGYEIPKLIHPILKKEAMLVIGDRQVMRVRHFSFLKKRLERLGSWVVSKIVGQEIPDAVSGFRAFHREALLHLHIVTRFSPTLEVLMQACFKHFKIVFVPISTNPPLRPSRLFKNHFSFIFNSSLTIFRTYLLYKPLKFFFTLGACLSTIGLLLGLRYLYILNFIPLESGKSPSFILAALFVFLGVQFFISGLLVENFVSHPVRNEDECDWVERNLTSENKIPLISEARGAQSRN